MITIREETPVDHRAIRLVTTAAFAGGEFGDNGEADLVDSLRVGSETILSLVACTADVLVGHVLFSPVVIRGAEGDSVGMGLAPMSVAPAHQKTGVGSSLVNAGLARLAAVQCSFVVVLGHADYYPRFGFEAASAYGVTHGFAGIPQELFFVKGLVSKSLREISGPAFYQPQFGPQHLG